MKSFQSQTGETPSSAGWLQWNHNKKPNINLFLTIVQSKQTIGLFVVICAIIMPTIGLKDFDMTKSRKPEEPL